MNIFIRNMSQFYLTFIWHLKLDVTPSIKYLAWVWICRDLNKFQENANALSQSLSFIYFYNFNEKRIQWEKNSMRKEFKSYLKLFILFKLYFKSRGIILKEHKFSFLPSLNLDLVQQNIYPNHWNKKKKRMNILQV